MKMNDQDHQGVQEVHVLFETPEVYRCSPFTHEVTIAAPELKPSYGVVFSPTPVPAQVWYSGPLPRVPRWMAPAARTVLVRKRAALSTVPVRRFAE